MKSLSFVRYVTIILALLAAASCSGSTGPPLTQSTSPLPHSIAHVIILLQENRSFNNLFMGFPGADTATSGKCERTKDAPWCPPSLTVPIKTVKLEGNGTLGGLNDIGHDHQSFELECDPNASGVCQMDGFDLVGLGEAGSLGPAKLYAYRHVDRSQTEPYWDLARQYTLADRMFFTATASSFVAHQQIIAGTTEIGPTESLTNQPNIQPWGCDAQGPERGRGQLVYTPILDVHGKVNPHGPFPCFTQYQTMADLLDAAGVTWKYYVASLYGRNSEFSGSVWNGFDAIEKVACIRRVYEKAKDFWNCTRGKDWSHVSSPNTNVLADIKNGSLPAVSWVIPELCESDHPASGANHGPKWITTVVNAVGQSKFWSSTAIIILWDDWGGWYDNVRPPQISYTSLGFRVPMIVVSPYARPHYISRTQYDFGSVLKFIETNFRLGSLGTSDASANSMQDVFDFSQRPNKFKAGRLPRVSPCPAGDSLQNVIKQDGGVPE
jgi:phospholipase C